MTDRRNILQTLNDHELIKRYRLDHDGIMFVVELIRDALTSPTQRSNAITPEMKVITTLRYLATGKMQQCSSDDLCLSQPSISRVITQTIEALSQSHIVKQFISFPLDVRTLQAHKRAFMDIAGFPGVDGVIDGTHICIITPSENEDVFVNRKRFHSINTQLVFSADYKILDIVAKWPGSTHDARILSESGLKQLFEGHYVPVNCHLLGDSGYPCKPWLLTPYLRPDPGPQLNYNRAHKKTRSVVERGIGQLKRRFHVLHGEVRLSPAKVCKVITACAVLHNICKVRQIPEPLESSHGNSDEGDCNEYDEDIQFTQGRDMSQSGLRHRAQFTNLHFRDGVEVAAAGWFI
ncbi:putative nuclease HARBI1 isoform X2 [Brienomyrus brachyistius]|uniref:putative nuclease HARBI1 isoform X4 n=1 Tax=Brienomyrus brachyistius TaxID=42636 RepID=UPI0020B42A98|nr:putative nuclease HARBI1 isoform X4 [Brienomyrus brachyistius]XP_048852794.1 putative nuclease HARBI1 isoform X5 [Brienomyrus brachyistius]XP_048852797.1 putative nuclease HARBI1 isoform X2 [Brienomyrus brachyistius]XP_048852851.1 putative nuclease HARBI1 isoform X2 [Brienomyrus brachyistius]